MEAAQPVLTADDSLGMEIGKAKETFRVYGTSAPREDKVTRHYTLMRTNQTLEFVQRMEAKVRAAATDRRRPGGGG